MNCTRKQIPCNIQFLTPLKPGAQQPAVDASASERVAQEHYGLLQRPWKVSTARADAFLAVSPLNLESMELLHHYTSTASLYLSGLPARKAMQVEVPRLALAHDMVMHSLLALSAVHLATLQPNRSDTLRKRAALSEQTAVPKFRRLIADIGNNTEHINAMMTFGAFMPLYLLAQSRWLGADAGRLPHPDDSQPHWFSLFRGSLKLLRYGSAAQVLAIQCPRMAARRPWPVAKR